MKRADSDEGLFAGFSCVADDDGRSASQAVNNTLQHLQHVASTWSRVLPTNAHYKSIGRLCLIKTTDDAWHGL